MRFIVPLLILVLAACAGSRSSTDSSSPSPAPSASPATALANGRSIYMTGLDVAGHRITASPPPLRSSCVQCHQATGRGGVHFPDGAVSADLRHNALVTDQHPPYTVATLERAISTGVDNQGGKLDRVMPRWRMSRRDLHDVALYVYGRLK